MANFWMDYIPRANLPDSVKGVAWDYVLARAGEATNVNDSLPVAGPEIGESSEPWRLEEKEEK